MTDIDHIYIVNGSSGEYSDHNEWPVCAVLTEDRAKAMADELNRLDKIVKEVRNRLSCEFEPAYLANNPKKWLSHAGHPQVSREHNSLIKKFGWAETTAKDKERLASYKASYDRKVEAYKAWESTERPAMIEKWNADYETARTAWLKENNPDAEAIEEMRKLDSNLGVHGYGTDYDYYELSVVK
jgi:hypothetical protein